MWRAQAVKPPASTGERPATDAVWFRQLFLAEYDRLCRYAVRGGASRDEAEELVQDVFARAWQSPASLREAKSPTAYLFGAVRHALLNRSRHRRTLTRLHDEARRSGRSPGVSTQTAITPDLVTEQRALATAVQAALAALPERGREALQLQRHSGLSYAEIAEVMAVSPSTVKTHIARALAALRDQLSPWRESAPAAPKSREVHPVSADRRTWGPSSQSLRTVDTPRDARARAQQR